MENIFVIKNKVTDFLLSPAGAGISISTAVVDICASLTKEEQEQVCELVEEEIEACPNCGTWFYRDESYEDDIYDDSYAAYCPECGAFMREIF